MRQVFERALVGRTLAGRYTLEEVIGSGGMSVVYRGLDQVLGRPVAVKVVALAAQDEAQRANLRERFRREAGSAARLAQHPNVVQVYDFGTDAELDLDFLVMELLRGRDLKQALAQGELPQGEALRVLREAARGLAAGHREGIVHRDVKPANIFLVGDGRHIDYVRILDFGIAKPLESEDDALTLTTAGQLPHSPAYASPEQLDPGAPLGTASDVYQLGLIAYELLTGERPYSESERQRIRAGEDVPLVDTARWRALPASLRGVISQALQREPGARYPDAAAFADALAHPDDATLLHPAAALPAGPLDAPVAELPLPAVPASPEALEAAAPEPVSTQPLSLPPAVTGRRASPALWGLPLVLLVLLLAVWTARRHRAVPTASTPATDTGAVAALHDRFLRLEGEASQRLAGARDSVPGDMTAADTATTPPSGAAGSAAAAAVQRVVLDLHAAWSAGDVERMMSHYAGRVDYYGVEGRARSAIRREREATIRRYDRRRITIQRQAVLLLRPDLARVLVDKEWDFVGSGDHWTGAMRQELMLRQQDGDWQVVAEKSTEVYRDDHRRG